MKPFHNLKRKAYANEITPQRKLSEIVLSLATREEINEALRKQAKGKFEEKLIIDNDQKTKKY